MPCLPVILDKDVLERAAEVEFSNGAAERAAAERMRAYVTSMVLLAVTFNGVGAGEAVI